MKRILIYILAAFFTTQLAYAEPIAVEQAESAIENNNVELLNKLIQDGLDLHAHDKQGNTLIYYTIANVADPMDIISLLVNKGADINAPSSQSGATPLVYAVSAADRIQAEAKRIYLQEPSPLKRQETEAEMKKKVVKAMKRAEELIVSLIDLGADVNQETPQGTPLMKASSNPWNEKIVQILLEAGADVNQQDQNGRTALFFAEAYGCVDISMRLIAAGGDVYIKDFDGKTYIEVDKKDLLPE